MKHNFKYFACLLVAVLCFGQVWAGADETVTFSNLGYSNQEVVSSYVGKDFVIGFDKGSNNNAPKYYTSGTAIRAYGGNKMTVQSNTKTITEIVLTFGSSDGSNAITTDAGTYSNGTWTGSASTVVFTIGGTSGNRRLASVAVTYATGGGSSSVAVASVSLDEDEIALEVGEKQTLIATVLPDNATDKGVTWESDDTDVATVEDGVVIAVGAGDATITCKSVADPTKYAECAVHVNPSPYTKSSLIFTGKYSDNGATANDGAEWEVTSDGSESNYDGTSGIHYGTNSANVTYVQLATSDISGTVAKVVVNARDAQACATISVSVGGTEFSCSEGATATNTSTDYTFTGSGTGEIIVRVDRGSSKAKAIYVKSVIVSYTPAAVEVKKPAFSIAGGTYLGAQSVGITCETEGAAIYYTLDGTEPSSTSTHYSSAISITETKTLKAIAIKDEVSSPIATATYTIINTEHAGTAGDPYSVADAKAVIDGIGTKADAYVSGKISQVDSYSDQYHSITYWISADGTTSGQQLQVYSGKGIGGANFSSVDDVVVKATVVVKGTLKKHNETYEFDYNNELVSYTEPVEPIVTLKQSGSAVTELNVEATEVANQEIDIVSANFESQITSVSAKLYEESTCETEITSGAWVTDITVNSAKLTFSVADNAGAVRQVWLKVTASDGTDEASAVLAISQAKYTVDYAELPFAYDGNGSGELPNGFTNSGVGTYSSSPAMKFDGTGDYIVIKINEAPGKLTYDIKNNSFSGGTFTVQESEDGENYTIVASHTEITGTQNEEVDLKQATRYVKFIYTEKVSGNVGLGKITISKYVAPAVKPIITTQPEGAEYAQGATANVLSIVAEAGNSGTLSYQWYSNDANSTEGAEAIENATDDEYTPSTESIGTIYYYCVVTEAGADATTTSDIVAVIVTAAPEPTGTFELFSGELTEGDYLITHNSEVALKCEINSDRFAALEVSASENKITNPDASIIWHIAQSGEYWTIYNVAAEKYAASTGAKNKGALLDAGSDDKALWSVSGSEFVNKQNTANSVNATLRYNSQNALNTSWACYATSTGETPTLYKKKVAGQPKTPTFTVASGTYTSAQTVGIECETEGVAIYYTTDGTTTPTSESNPYTGPISVSETTTIKAIAIKNNISSDVASATYTIVVIEHAGTADDPYTVVDAHNAIMVGGDLTNKYVSGIISQVDEFNSTYSSITYWISNDGTTNNQLEVYSGKGIGGTNFTSINDLNVNDIVVVKGTLKEYNSIHEFDKNNELVSLEKPNVPTVTLKQSDVIVTELNVAATEVANQAIDVECANFASAISSVNAKLYEESTCETEITSGAWVTDITVNGAKDQLTFNIADNTGDARQVWMKVTASDGTNEASAILVISQAKSAFATLPFAFDGGKEDIANAGGMTQNGLGTDYNNSPKLKFDNTGDNLIIRINEAPGKLTYDIKNNTFSGGTFTVQESADGETYTEVASHTEIENTQNEEVELKQATRYVKFIYTEKATGNVGLGNITISKSVNPDPEPVYDFVEVRTDLVNGYHYTLCLKKKIVAVDGGTFWTVGRRDAAHTVAYLEEVILPLQAGVPVIFQATASTLKVAYEGDEVDDPAVVDGNALRGTFSELNAAALAAACTNMYMLYNNQICPVKPYNGNFLSAFRAYIDDNAMTTGDAPQTPGRRVRSIPMQGNVATGIDNIGISDQPMKVFIDGQLYILRGEKLYDATGRMVK